MNAKRRPLLSHKPIERSKGRMNDYIQLILCHPEVILYHGGCVVTFEISIGGAVIVIFFEPAVISRYNLIPTEGIVDVTRLVMRRSNGYDGTFTNKERYELQRRIVAVEDATSFEKGPSVGIEPFGATDVIIPVRQIDAVADVVAVGVHFCVLIDGSNEEVRAVHELVLRQVVNLLAVFKRSAL